ncbi:MAG: chorismate lyase [Betaproteobacteria bacterium]|nr:chorismate lyase [Betaproteobacteria bacterium]
MGRGFSRAASWSDFLPCAASEATHSSWLRERGSLSMRLRGCGPFHVKAQKPENARIAALSRNPYAVFSEAASCLGLSPRERIKVRKVVLFCNGRPAVFAWTVYSAEIHWPLRRWLQNRGNRSLGDLLFGHPGFERGPLQFSRIDRRHPFYEEASKALAAHPPEFWARRSAFRFGGKSLLVTELFSPEFIRAQKGLKGCEE